MDNLVLPKIVAVGIYNAQLATKKTVTKNRKTTMFEIELPLERGGISYIDDSAHDISETTVICAKPGQLRHTRLPFKCYYVHMIVNEGQIFDTLSTLQNYIEIGEEKEVKEIFASLCEHYDVKTPESELIVQSLILRLVYTINRFDSIFKFRHSPKANNQVIIEDTLKYISDNLTSDLSLESLSGRANFSPIYFHKLFKTSTGINLRNYIEEQRIKKATELLTSTAKTLTQIAYECGFSSQSYFSYAFKRKTKFTPREYAKKLQSKYEDVK